MLLPVNWQSSKIEQHTSNTYTHNDQSQEHPRQYKEAPSVGSGPETTAAEDEQLQHLIDTSRSRNSDQSKRKRWYGAEAKQMLRHLDEIRHRTEAAQRNAVSKVGKVSLLDKLFALFTDKPDDEGPKHDCFFSAFNCPVNPARNIPGVRRVRITADERRKLLAAKQRAATSAVAMTPRHGTREGHGTTTTATSSSNGFEAVPLKQEDGTTTD
ncbi:hypothetical protein niasHT_036522 [Heterodera trifolii]|uniref:Uncharacterized protein n=1 Tax=Heterodera trifolii TaxID=157864 RepID=A0ABD2J3V0_9BILA